MEYYIIMVSFLSKQKKQKVIVKILIFIPHLLLLSMFSQCLQSLCTITNKELNYSNVRVMHISVSLNPDQPEKSSCAPAAQASVLMIIDQLFSVAVTCLFLTIHFSFFTSFLSFSEASSSFSATRVARFGFSPKKNSAVVKRSAE